MQAKIPGIIGLIVALAAVLNFILNACGLPAIAVDEGAITGVVNGVVGFIGVLTTMWYNFGTTTAAKVGQNITDGIKDGTIDLGEAQKLINNATKKTVALINKPEVTD